jgi:hypothetical protein
MYQRIVEMTVTKAVGDADMAFTDRGDLVLRDVGEKHAEDCHCRCPDIGFCRQVKVTVDGPGSELEVDLFWRERSAS